MSQENNVDINFYAEWELKDSIKIGRTLMKKIISGNVFSKLEEQEESFPEGHSDFGANISRIPLKEIRFLLLYEFSDHLSGECYKLKSETKNQDESLASSFSNAKVLTTFVTFLLDKNITHIELG